MKQDKHKHYSEVLARYNTLLKGYLASRLFFFAVKKWKTALWWNMMLFHLSTNSQTQNHITVGWVCHFCWLMFPPCLYCRIFNLILLTWKDMQCSRDSNLFKSDSPQASLFQMDETAQEFWHRGLCDLLTLDHRFYPSVCVCACMGVQECTLYNNMFFENARI